MFAVHARLVREIAYRYRVRVTRVCADVCICAISFLQSTQVPRENP